jgi:hypothetical protein
MSKRESVLALQKSKPLCQIMESSHLQTSLPYIDDDAEDLQSKVIYMIKT